MADITPRGDRYYSAGRAARYLCRASACFATYKSATGKRRREWRRLIDSHQPRMGVWGTIHADSRFT